MTAYYDLPGTDGRGFVELPWGEKSPVRSFLSLKTEGDMRHSVRRHRPDRQRLFRKLGIDEGRVYACHQVHSRDVIVLRRGAPEAFLPLRADGLLSDRPEAILAVSAADCLPIHLLDPRRGALGLLHSGYQGTGIVRQAIRRMREEYGSDPASLQVLIGPGIGPCCYDVPEERYASFLREYGPQVAFRREGRYFLDLQRANLDLLRAEGVEDIRVVRDCTSCNPLLSSFRRDGPAGLRHMLVLFGRREAFERRPGLPLRRLAAAARRRIRKAFQEAR